MSKDGGGSDSGGRGSQVDVGGRGSKAEAGLSGPQAGSKSDFFDKVYVVVGQVPPGKVTTYGLIARHIGLASAARTVGWALNGAAASGLPCHRVVNRFGALSGRMAFSNPHAMEDQLRNEGVAFRDDGTVDMDEHLWDPADALRA